MTVFYAAHTAFFCPERSRPHLHAYRHGAVIPRPARLLGVPVGLEEQRPPAGLPAVPERVVPPGTLADVRRHARTAVVAVLHPAVPIIAEEGLTVLQHLAIIHRDI